MTLFWSKLKPLCTKEVEVQCAHTTHISNTYPSQIFGYVQVRRTSDKTILLISLSVHSGFKVQENSRQSQKSLFPVPWRRCDVLLAAIKRWRCCSTRCTDAYCTHGWRVRRVCRQAQDVRGLLSQPYEIDGWQGSQLILHRSKPKWIDACNQ